MISELTYTRVYHLAVGDILLIARLHAFQRPAGEKFHHLGFIGKLALLVMEVSQREAVRVFLYNVYHTLNP